ncbi:MAG: putative TetR-family transcriptional regulator [Amycolatopsis sp.]|jgi:AcrR family transcriptional regulator|uniref:TetR/AcrR family transcriptional regulator n=1 Tax=Amycolatopsis sp. TaxID=37632 RepID=UPI002637866E|nr:TetR/AcrR family transcriptional regulator [Amycolatopsis sp.]MCU1681438.1 putative TetR-family transcriptional regulator [Amycolatopsis sp.]
MRTYGGKTSEERRADRRARLIEAALELFGAQGFAATSARAVLRQAGLIDRYFTESFAGMEELLAEVHDEIHNATFSAVAAAVDRTAEPAEQMRQMVDTIARELERDPRAGRVKLIEVVGAGPLVETHRRRALHQYTDATAALLPPLPPDASLNREALAAAVVAGINGLLEEWLTKSFDVSREQLVSHAVLLFRGVEQAMREHTG